MSRGPGRWQRVLLGMLEQQSMISVRTAVMAELQREPVRAEMVAARRAARTLVQAGRCRAIYLGECRRCYEFTSTWWCAACNCGSAQALVVTRFDGPGARLGSLVGLGGAPEWISVAPGDSDPGATLTDGVA